MTKEVVKMTKVQFKLKSHTNYPLEKLIKK